MSFFRVHALAFADAVRRLAAQPFASLLSLLVLAVALALPAIAAVGLRSALALTSGLDTDPHVNVFLALDAGDEDVKRIEQAIRATPGVAGLRFISRGQAFDELRATSHLAEILATLDRNPLPHAFAVRLDAAALGTAGSLKDAWSHLPKVDQVNADFEWAERLGGWVRFGTRLLVLLALLLALAVGFVVGHLIRLQALTRRSEIEVSQLLGATAADVRRPLIYHGFLQGILSGALAVGLAGALALWAGHEMQVLAPSYATELKVVFFTPMEMVAIILGTGVLGWIAAWIAAHREIRRFARA